MTIPLHPGSYPLFDGVSPQMAQGIGAAASGMVGGVMRDLQGAHGITVTTAALADALIFGAATVLARAGMTPKQIEQRFLFVLATTRQHLMQQPEGNN